MSVMRLGFLFTVMHNNKFSSLAHAQPPSSRGHLLRLKWSSTFSFYAFWSHLHLCLPLPILLNFKMSYVYSVMNRKSFKGHVVFFAFLSHYVALRLLSPHFETLQAGRQYDSLGLINTVHFTVVVDGREFPQRQTLLFSMTRKVPVCQVFSTRDWSCWAYFSFFPQ